MYNLRTLKFSGQTSSINSDKSNSLLPPPSTDARLGSVGAQEREGKKVLHSWPWRAVETVTTFIKPLDIVGTVIHFCETEKHQGADTKK